jgi:hypothetical protein
MNRVAPLLRLLTWSAASLTVLMSTGCATITRGNKQVVHLVTEPPAARVVVDGKPYISPADVRLQRNTPAHEVTVSKEGYQTITFKLKSRWDGGGVKAWAVDAAVPGGSALFAIDTLYGAAREYDKIATIKLPKAVEPNPAPITLYEYKGKLLTKVDYDAAVEHDKLFKSKKKGKEPAGTQPTGTAQASS